MRTAWSNMVNQMQEYNVHDSGMDIIIILQKVMVIV